MSTLLREIIIAIIGGAVPTTLSFITNYFIPFLKTLSETTFIWMSLMELFLIGFLVTFIYLRVKHYKKTIKLLEGKITTLQSTIKTLQQKPKYLRKFSLLWERETLIPICPIHNLEVAECNLGVGYHWKCIACDKLHPIPEPLNKLKAQLMQTPSFLNP